MQRKPVQSSKLASVGYDPDIATLEIEFHKGKIYQYLKVSEEVFQNLMSAPSKGEYFDKFIDNADYPCKEATYR